LTKLHRCQSASSRSAAPYPGDPEFTPKYSFPSISAAATVPASGRHAGSPFGVRTHPSIGVGLHPARALMREPRSLVVGHIEYPD
jgi:hypothetical protein